MTFSVQYNASLPLGIVSGQTELLPIPKMSLLFVKTWDLGRSGVGNKHTKVDSIFTFHVLIIWIQAIRDKGCGILESLETLADLVNTVESQTKHIGRRLSLSMPHASQNRLSQNLKRLVQDKQTRSMPTGYMKESFETRMDLINEKVSQSLSSLVQIALLTRESRRMRW